ncbi:translationally-controlled tumor protein homolog [Asterias amurensis]|uniref:translationally-controlled tumor protein homolog n=1 Tax=Asterias amurensis TaxID=7602 RepID=UPI003AB519AF
MALFTGITVKYFSLILRYLMVSYLLKASLHFGDVCSSADATGYNTEEVFKRMLAFKDVITGKEMFTDSFKYTLVDDIVYEVDARYKPIDNGMESVPLLKADAEVHDDLDVVPDLVEASNLVEGPLKTVDDKKVQIKAYLKNLSGRFDDPDEKLLFQLKITRYFDELLGKSWQNLDKFLMYWGEDDELDNEGMCILMGHRDSGSPYFVFIKLGLYNEKILKALETSIILKIIVSITTYLVTSNHRGLLIHLNTN